MANVKSAIKDLDPSDLIPTHVYCHECEDVTPYACCTPEQVDGRPSLFRGAIHCGECEVALLTLYFDLGDS